MGVNRNIQDAVPELQQAWVHLKGQYNVQYPMDPTVILSEVHRSAAVQTAYYAQGRNSLGTVNALRKTAGLPAIGKTENSRKITFKKAGHSKHEASPSQAFDIAFVKEDGTLDWSPKLFERAARIIRDAYPLITWGGDWNHNGKTSDETFIDFPHFQV